MVEKRTIISIDVDDPAESGDSAALLKQTSPASLSTSSMTDETKPMSPASDSSSSQTISSTGLKVLILLAVQNCSKNLLMRYVMKDKPNFLTSAAIIGVEILKLVLSTLYVLIVDRRPLSDIYAFLKDDNRNSLLLGVPAAAYSLQMSLEYMALANLDVAVFSVLVQTKLLATASFAAVFLRKKLKYVQVISLVLLMVGVMLCNMSKIGSSDEEAVDAHKMRGIFATLGIALSSGFASVYTEKVIKARRNNNVERKNYSLAFMQIQLALVSLGIIGMYATIKDYEAIRTRGLWNNFTPGAFVSIFNTALGGLTVAAVLKYADSVLKGYATAMSVVMTGVLSMVIFKTQLNAVYFLGIVNVVCAVLLYNGKDLDRFLC